MSSYSIAAAQQQLTRLIEEAEAGETVTITRDGKPIAELRPARATAPSLSKAEIAALRSRRDARPPLGDAAVAIIREMREAER